MKKSIFFFKAQDKTSRLADPQSTNAVNAIDYLTISLPLDQSVYQRNTNNETTITVAGQSDFVGITSSIEWQLVRIDPIVKIAIKDDLIFGN